MSSSVNRRRFLQLLSLTGLTNLACLPALHAEETLPPVDPVKSHPDNLTLLVGGAQDSELGEWARRLAVLFAKDMQDTSPIPLHYTLGYDSVTAANRFDTRNQPDGNTALVTSGIPMIAALMADPRVHFDYERWIPIVTALSPILTLARQPFHNSIPDFLKNRSMKVGVSTLPGKELPTLLGVELLQIRAYPVTGLTTYTAGIEALRNRKIDLLQIDSAEGFAELPKLLKEGFHIFFSFDDNNQYAPSFTSLYTKMPHYRTRSTLFEMWQALAIIARINFTVVLPMLSPSPLVTKWRLNANKLFQDNDFITKLQQNNLTLENTQGTIQTFTQSIPSTTAILALRRWLALKSAQWQI